MPPHDDTTRADRDPAPRYPPPDPSPSPSDASGDRRPPRRRAHRWAHLPPVRVGWIADALGKFLESTGRAHVFGAGGLKRVAARKAGESLMEAVDWMAPRCALMVYVADGDDAGGSDVYDLVRPVNPLRLSHDAGEDEAEVVGYRARDEGRAVVASGPGGGGFARSPACESFLGAVELGFGRPVELLVGGFVRDGSLAPAVDGLLARGRRVTIVRDAISFPARKPQRRPPRGWAGDGTVRSVADLRASSGVFRQSTFADLEMAEAHVRMESLARRAPRFSSLHSLDEAVPWELYRARLEASRTRSDDALPRADTLMNDVLVTWKSILLGAIYEVSDEDLEFLVLDRLSFRRFAGLHMTELPPSAQVLKVHRELWNRTGVMAELVADLDRRWRKAGYGLPGLERLKGPSPAGSGSPADGGLERAGSRPGPRAVSKASRGSRRRSRRKRKGKRRKKGR